MSWSDENDGRKRAILSSDKPPADEPEPSADERRKGHKALRAKDGQLETFDPNTPAEVSGEPEAPTLYAHRCGYCGAYEGTVKENEVCSASTEDDMHPHRFGIYEVYAASRVEPGATREALEKVRVALDGFGDGSLARIAKHFDTGSEEWAIIHNTDESIILALAALDDLTGQF